MEWARGGRVRSLIRCGAMHWLLLTTDMWGILAPIVLYVVFVIVRLFLMVIRAGGAVVSIFFLVM